MIHNSLPCLDSYIFFFFFFFFLYFIFFFFFFFLDLENNFILNYNNNTITWFKWKKIKYMKWNIIYYNNYKSALDAIVSNFSHSSMITPRSLLRVIILVLVLSNESVSDLSPGGEKFMPYHFDVDALSDGRFNRFNRIPFYHQSKKIDKLMVLRLLETPQFLTKYGTVNKSWILF